MTPYESHLHWLETQNAEMASLLQSWANLNTGTFNTRGLKKMAEMVAVELQGTTSHVQILPAASAEQVNDHGETELLELGPNVVASCRPEAPVRVLLSIHMDTVYGEDSQFQVAALSDEQTLHGPGVADAKGGLVILLFALKAFERFVHLTGQKRVGWEVIINSDEEIGSPGSLPLFSQAAEKVQLALLFEPSLPHGGLISTRKGTGNFSIVVHGQSAHSGRDFHLGRNAIVAAADITTELHALNGRWPGMTLNVARIDGGGPNNMVPGIAIVRFNIRYEEQKHEAAIHLALTEIITRISQQRLVTMSLHGQFQSPPKLLTPEMETLLTQFKSCGNLLGFDLTWSPSGGASDGNRLAAFGVPNVDTLGVRGGNIHSHDEFALIDSLVERARLTALFLMRLADGELKPPATNARRNEPSPSIHP